MDVNWTQIGWGCVFGLIVGILVYAIGSYLDWRRDRKFQELTEVHPAAKKAAEGLNQMASEVSRFKFPKMRKSEENDGA